VRNRALGVGFFTPGGMVDFALGPVLILYLVAPFGTDARAWLMLPGLALGAAGSCSCRSGSRTPAVLSASGSTGGSFGAPVGVLALAGSFTSEPPKARQRRRRARDGRGRHRLDLTGVET
jgi:hypothetical protein